MRILLFLTIFLFIGCKENDEKAILKASYLCKNVKKITRLNSLLLDSEYYLECDNGDTFNFLIN